MKIESNINGVMAQLTRLRHVTIPGAIERAVDPLRWIGPAKVVAKKALLLVAQPQDRWILEAFVEAVAVAAIPDGFRLRASNPMPGTPSIAEAQAARTSPWFLMGRGTSQQTLGYDIAGRPINQLEQILLDWVNAPVEELGKKTDARDWDRTPEDTAQFISFLLLTPKTSERIERARERLTPHVEAFIAQQFPGNLSSETVRLWLRTVIEAWREWIARELPKAVVDELWIAARKKG